MKKESKRSVLPANRFSAESEYEETNIWRCYWLHPSVGSNNIICYLWCSFQNLKILNYVIFQVKAEFKFIFKFIYNFCFEISKSKFQLEVSDLVCTCNWKDLDWSFFILHLLFSYCTFVFSLFHKLFVVFFFKIYIWQCEKRGKETAI